MYIIGEEELQAVRKVFESGRLFRYQPDGGECDAFEREFAERLGVPHSIILSSGTNALIGALSSCGVGPGDEVIIPAYTFVATAAAVLQVGAVPVVADIDEQLSMDVADARRRISPRTKVIIPVHMDGLASNLGPLLEMASESGLFVIEDAAQAIGGGYRGKPLGAWGDFGCFSLNENKNISCGEGGIVVMKRREFYDRAFSMQDISARFNPVKRTMLQDARFSGGASMRVSEIQGAIMRVQLRRLDGILSSLRERKSLLRDALGGHGSVKLVSGYCGDGDCGSSLHLLFPDPMTALIVGRELRRQHVPLFPVLTRPAHVCWKWDPVLKVNSADYVESVSILSRTLKLDINPSWNMDEVRELARKIGSALEQMPGGKI